MKKTFNDFCASIAPNKATARTKTSCQPIMPRFATENTFVVSSSVVFHAKTGTGKTKPDKLITIIKNPRSTTVQSSDNNGGFGDDMRMLYKRLIAVFFNGFIKIFFFNYTFLAPNFFAIII